MAETDQDQKTEEASDKRIQEARDEGQWPISREMATWSLFIAILVVVAWLGPVMGRQLTQGLRVFLEQPHEISLEGNGIQVALTHVMMNVGLASVLVFSLLAASVIVGTMVQTGFFFNPARLKLDASRLNPLTGFKNLFSSNALAELLKSFVKLVVIGTVVFFIFAPLFDVLPFFIGRDLADTLPFLHHEVIHMIVILMLIITVIAVADIVYQRHRFFKGLRMTKQEVKDEHKQTEGDPMIKSRLRQIRMEKARKRMMAQVPKADVVITNPTHYAVALQYDNTKMPAPTVLAKGVDRVAERIREVADEHAIPLVSNPPLARALYDTVDIDEVISPLHYRAVAEVISYVYKLKGKKN
jgi:flagellar biosynthetic protein FlhB